MFSSEATDRRNKVWRAQTDKSVEDKVWRAQTDKSVEEKLCLQVLLMLFAIVVRRQVDGTVTILVATY